MNNTETKQIEVGQHAFTTQDGELALSLITAGCTFAPVAAGGPAQMHFTPDICRNRWVTQRDASGQKVRVPLLKTPASPEEFEIAVMRAVKMDIPGVITWYFVRDEVFREAMEMHDRLAKEASEAARDGRAMSLPPFSTLTEAAAIMLVCYIRRCNEQDMPTHARLRPPNLAVGDVRKTVTPKEGVPGEVLEQMSYTATGGGRIWSLNLSDEKRATVMPDGKRFIHPKQKCP
jgi:hypothetical protein